MASIQTTKSFQGLNRSMLALDKRAAGAGVTGLAGFLVLLAVAAVFFVTEFYFIAMAAMSVALLTYVTGAELGKLLMSSVTVFFSSKHLTPKANQMQQDLLALEETLMLKRDANGEITAEPLATGQTIHLPDNPLSRDIKTMLEKEKSPRYAEYVAHSYYAECQEIYEQFSSHFEFVSGAMPLFGLIGTIVGLITMFDSLGGDVTVEALSPQLALALKTTLYGAIFSSLYRIIGTRFEQRLSSLDYDFDAFTRALEVIMESKATVEVKR